MRKKCDALDKTHNRNQGLQMIVRQRIDNATNEADVELWRSPKQLSNCLGAFFG
jgi:hypothetical protein